MLTMENVTALRMRRHCLTRRAGVAEYDALYRDLSPGLNVHWHGFGQPPCLVERADFDDVEYNGRRQRQRILVKGRFQNGNIGFVEAAQMELFAGLYRRPYKPTEHSELLRELIGREGPLNIEAMKRMTGLLVKQITPALHRLQEAFLVFEDQFDGEWDRGWYLFDEMFPDVDPARISRTEALLRVLPRLAHRQVYLTAADAKDFYGLPARDVAAAMEELARQGIEVERKARPIEIFSLEYGGSPAENEYELTVRCSKGTYIRVLLEDIAAAMGQKGTMSALRRVAAGVYTEADAHTLEEIQAAKNEGPAALEALMLPVESVFGSLPLLTVAPKVEQHLYNGCPTSRYPAADGRYRVRNEAGQFLGLANIVGGVLKVEKLFVERN